MRILGFFISIAILFGVGSYFWNMGENKGTAIPETYKTMDSLETQGIYGEDYKFEGLAEGQVVSVKDFHGKIILFSFWATWCPPCVDEFPSLLKLLDVFPDKVVLFAISKDKNRDDVKNFIDAFQGWRKNLHVVFDNKDAVSKALKVGILPEGYIFDSQGKLVKKILGIQDWATPGAIQYFKSL